MPDVVLKTYIRDNLTIHGQNAVVEFAWHGGEPTLAPGIFTAGPWLIKTNLALADIFETPFRPMARC